MKAELELVTRCQHGALREILNRLGWTQAELARRGGLTPNQVGEIINFNKIPSTKTADAIQRALGEAGEYFDVLEQWPETFEGIRPGLKKVETAELPMRSLIGCREAMMLPTSEHCSGNGLFTAMEEYLSTLTEKEKRVLEARFYESRTLTDVACELRFRKGGGERVRQIQEKALRKLRHPARLRIIEQFVGAFLSKHQRGLGL